MVISPSIIASIYSCVSVLRHENMPPAAVDFPAVESKSIRSS